MSVKTELSRITIDIPKIDHKKLKALAALHDKSMRDVILELIEGYLGCRKTHLPNKKTADALNNVATGKNLVKAKNADELFKKLGL